jgi:hypothetical protein
MSSREASRYFLSAHGMRVAHETLSNWRYLGIGPEFRRSGRAVVYTRAALDAFAESRLSAPLRSTREPREKVASAEPAMGSA